jgi:predicted permease
MPSLGLLFNYFEFIPNTVITSSIQNLGIGASGFALFTFGLTLGSIKLRKEDFSTNMLVIVFIKNIIHPFISFFIGKYILHLEGYWLYSLVIATSAPTAFVVYLISKQFSIEAELVKKVVAITSILSLVSLVFIAIILEFVGLSNL